MSAQRKSFETVMVEQLKVACDGGAGGLGHPRVYLHIDRAVGETTCPYCSKRYVLDVSAYKEHH